MKNLFVNKIKERYLMKTLIEFNNFPPNFSSINRILIINNSTISIPQISPQLQVLTNLKTFKILIIIIQQLKFWDKEKKNKKNNNIVGL